VDWEQVTHVALSSRCSSRRRSSTAARSLRGCEFRCELRVRVTHQRLAERRRVSAAVDGTYTHDMCSVGSVGGEEEEEEEEEGDVEVKEEEEEEDEGGITTVL